MRELNIKKMSDTDLATLFMRLNNVFCNREETFYKKFEETFCKLKEEIDRRNWTLIYREAIKCLRNNGRNQFRVARDYTDAVLNGYNYFTTNTSHEIGSFYTKMGNPILVTLVCNWSKF